MKQSKKIKWVLLGLSLWSVLISAGSGERISVLPRDLPPGVPDTAGAVRLAKAPHGGIQPQAVMDERGGLHLVYLSGEPFASDVFYVRREAGSKNLSAPLRVNSQPGSAIAFGAMRGAHLAIGKNGRVHVAWNGSITAEPRGPENSDPMLYARMNDKGNAFEAQRNLMQLSSGLEGGGSVAADRAGHVYVAWHGDGQKRGEQHRRVWLARSNDDGRTFAREETAFDEETGASGSCGMRAFADHKGALYLLYRKATGLTRRGMFLLVSTNRGRSFRGLALDEWELPACPMSTAAMTVGWSAAKPAVAAWENDRQVYFAPVDPKTSQRLATTTAPGSTGRRKHPVAAVNARGETILVWVEVKGWDKEGSLAWQVFDRDGTPTAEKGAAPGVPVWGSAAVVAEADGRFTIYY